jgi:hypothetical protein
MTASRVVTQHSELDEIGTTSHPQIDAYLSSSFVVVGANSLPKARRIVGGLNVTVTDNGPGNNIVISSTGGGGAGAQMIWNEVPFGVIDGINNSYTLTVSPNPSNATMVFYNGQKVRNPDDFSITGQTIAFVSPPVVGSAIEVTYEVSTSTTSSIRWNEVVTGSIDGANMTFTISSSPNPSTALMLYYNGQKLSQGAGKDFTLFGNTITSLFPPVSGSILEATYPY